MNLTEQESYHHSLMKQGLLLITDSMTICTSDRLLRESKQDDNLHRIDDFTNLDISNDIVNMVRSFLTRIDKDLLSNSPPPSSKSIIFQSNCGLHSSISARAIAEYGKSSPPDLDIEGHSLATIPYYKPTYEITSSLKTDVTWDRRTKETALDRSSLLLYRAACVESRTCRNHAKCRLCAMDGLSNRRPSCPFFNS